MTKWEYAMNPLMVKPVGENLVAELNYVAGREKFLNRMGEDGWELIAIDRNGIGYFKRPVGCTCECTT